MQHFSILPFALCTLSAALAAQQPKPPVAQQIARIDTLHGDVRTDNYFWLREKSNPKVLAYLDSENAYTEAGMRHTQALQDKLYREMLGRIRETDLSVPYRDNGYWYYTRTEQGKAYPILCRKRGSLDAKEEVYLDENALAAGKKFFELGEKQVSPDGERLVYLQDTTALRVYTLLVKDLKTGQTLADTIGEVVPGVAWANDNRTIFYSTADSARRTNAVWRHVIGQPRASDLKVFQDDDLLNNVGVARSKSGKFVLDRRRRIHELRVACHPYCRSGCRAARDRAASCERRVQRRSHCGRVPHGDERQRAQLQDRAHSRNGLLASKVDRLGSGE